MSHLLHIVPAGLSLTFLSLACSDSLAPGILGQAYRLDQVANEPVPAPLYSNERGTVYVLSQYIRFGPKGSGSFQETTELVPHTANQPGVDPVESSIGIQWNQVNGRVEIVFDCPSNADCVPGPHLVARIEGHRLRAAWGPGMSGRSPLIYTEVPSPQ